MTVTIDDIRAAAESISGEVVETPLVRSGGLSDLLGAEIYLKLETLQRTGSFKDRGALVKLKSLKEKAAKAGVIAISAGNHAQGVAYHAQRLGIPATIVMPKGTPFTKVIHTEAFGANVILHGDNVNEAEPFADEMAAQDGLTFIHPYDDPRIVAGQGTIAIEMLDAVPDLDVIVVPIGGGGLISGVATAAKALRPDIGIVGVEAELYPSMYQALSGLPPSSGGETIAEGIAVKTPGELTLEIVRALVDDIVLVDEAELEAAVQVMIEEAKVLAEGAGAAPLAAIVQELERFAGRKVGIVVGGGNIDSRLLASVLMRGMVRAGRMARLRVTISDQPGTLAQIAQRIGDTGGNIVEIVHQRMFYDVPVKLAEADIVVETRDESHIQEIIAQLAAAGFPTVRLDDTATRNP
ncbi:MAG: threonine ammonia-lyase [Alphaproteobacteria bacterium]|jgi:threonine dehydratase|nr:threonine ammonia-lyase [Alphaproteobacteria bacterium]